LSSMFDKKSLSRRQFLGFAWGASLVVFAGQTLAALFKFLKPVASEGFGGLVLAGKAEEFPAGSVNRVLAGRFYIIRTTEGLLALSQRCTHLGCAVPWSEEEEQFHCPCHGSLFNRHGEVTGGPAPRPLDYYPILVKDGEVWVDTGSPQERSRFDPGQVTRV
jgi:cytochrome b6-f complex iron-sulfur subunit